MIRYVDPDGVEHAVGVEFQTLVLFDPASDSIAIRVRRVTRYDDTVEVHCAIIDDGVVPAPVRWVLVTEGVEAPVLVRVPCEMLAGWTAADRPEIADWIVGQLREAQNPGVAISGNSRVLVIGADPL